MTQSEPQSGLHLALIMDGNGRWAQQRGLPRCAGRRLHLRLAVDYSAREALVRAARFAAADPGSGFEQALARAQHADSAPPVDLLIRTGGEQRLSDFLLWECAYAEFLFLKKMWPEFCARDLEDALAEFRTRDRRFGRIKTARVASKSCFLQTTSSHLSF